MGKRKAEKRAAKDDGDDGQPAGAQRAPKRVRLAVEADGARSQQPPNAPAAPAAPAPPAADAPQLPFCVRWTLDETDPANWTPLEFLPWHSNMTVARADAASLKQRDTTSAAHHPPLLWRCDADGKPLKNGGITVPGLQLLQWTAATQPRPPELDLLLQRNASTGAPGAFVLFTMPPPTAASAPERTFLSMSDANIPALVTFLRSHYPKTDKVGHGPIDSSGAAFPMVGRDAAVTALAGHVASRFARYESGNYRDQKLHRIAVAAAGPGTGKTRLLWESLSLLQAHFAQSSDASGRDLAQLVAGGVRVFATYGNGTGLLDSEVQEGTSAVVGGYAARLLHSHFCSDDVRFYAFVQNLARHGFGLDESQLLRQLGLHTTLQMIAHDVVSHGSASARQLDRTGSVTDRYQFMVITLDEFTWLSTDSLKHLLAAMRNIMSAPVHTVGSDGRVIFVQPMIGGTSMSFAVNALSESGMIALQMAVPPLGIDDVLTILRTPELLPQESSKLLGVPWFLELVADISGHPRSLDLLVQRVRLLSDTSSAVTASDLRAALRLELRSYYRLVPSIDKGVRLRAARAAILGESVDGEEYQAAEERGLVLRIEQGDCTYLHIPLIFLEAFAENWLGDPSFTAVRHLFKDGLNLHLARVTAWQHFEVEVLRIEALRLACTAGSARPLAAFLRGALGDMKSLNRWWTIAQPGNPVVVLPHRVPFGASVKTSYDSIRCEADNTATADLPTPECERFSLRDVLMGLNTAGAPFDQFSSRITDPQKRPGLLCMQSKHTSMLHGDELSLPQIQDEYGKIAEAMRDKRLRAHFTCKDARLPFVVLLHTTKPLASDVTAAVLPPRCFVVGRGQFADYFGTVFGARIEMAARATTAAAVAAP